MNEIQLASQHRKSFFRLAGDFRFAIIQGGSLSKMLVVFGAATGWGGGVDCFSPSCDGTGVPAGEFSCVSGRMVVVGRENVHAHVRCGFNGQ